MSATNMEISETTAVGAVVPYQVEFSVRPRKAVAKAARDAKRLQRPECGLCNEKFFNTFSLNRHMNVQHAATTLCLFTCPVCASPYQNLGSLYRHKNSKHSGLVHHCDDCNADFAAKEYLSQHLRTKKHIANALAAAAEEARLQAMQVSQEESLREQQATLTVSDEQA